MLAAGELVEVVQEGEVVGLLQVRLLASTMKHMEGVSEGSEEGRRPGVDRETMNGCKKETQRTHLWYKRAATVIGSDVNKWISHLYIMKKKRCKSYFLFFNIVQNK